MTTPESAQAPSRTLRLWPGIIAVALLFISRFGVKALIPGIEGFGKGMLGSFGFVIVFLIWWAFFSRAAWVERLSAIGLFAVALGGTWLLRHESMWMLWLLGYAIPGLCLAFIIWAVATRRLPDRVRRITMVATILLACGVWLFVREDGINGDHVARYGWRWTASPEERLLAQTANPPVTAPVAAPTIAATTAQPAASPSVAPATERCVSSSRPSGYMAEV